MIWLMWIRSLTSKTSYEDSRLTDVHVRGMRPLRHLLIENVAARRTGEPDNFRSFYHARKFNKHDCIIQLIFSIVSFKFK